MSAYSSDSHLLSSPPSFPHSSPASFLPSSLPYSSGGRHDTTALCVRDSELVRMSKDAFRVISQDSPLALSTLFGNMARRLNAARDARLRPSGRADGGKVLLDG